ncbi:histone chaperone ASF1 [Saprolegnia diclina VS20]|uniref:Histone chaperone ASF1 n=1 Tax=Saprolegnia diclina (strain VS20) TaxID=1156394 RepID=T0QFJ4_SAPDV|nr:histone chaperone ASF1 [Saprolegnia diclina VS20]EQC33456.1 histone chaperone ASF1 [Saprolegnia diclina VS20]|eukprot:XP_008613096.1 histone chaperone ASF1 [Saprolegnia diclina VS20]
MAYVTLTNITVLDNPTAFTNPFQFEVTFECAHPLEDDLEWKITYVGSAEDESRDQVLEEVLVGPVPVGTNKFVFQSEPPNPSLIPDEDKIGVTVVLVTCAYKGREFVRVGYYVNNDYSDPALIENPPASVDITKLARNILADKPRVTRFPIDWAPASQMADMAMLDGNDLLNEEDLINAAKQLDNLHPDIVIGDDHAAGDDENDDVEMGDDDVDMDDDDDVDSGIEFEDDI